MQKKVLLYSVSGPKDINFEISHVIGNMEYEI